MTQCSRTPKGFYLQATVYKGIFGGGAVSRIYSCLSSVGIDRVDKPATMLRYSKEVSSQRTLTTEVTPLTTNCAALRHLHTVTSTWEKMVSFKTNSWGTLENPRILSNSSSCITAVTLDHFEIFRSQALFWGSTLLHPHYRLAICRRILSPLRTNVMYTVTYIVINHLFGET